MLDAEGLDETRGPSTWVRYRLARHSGRKTSIVYLPDVPRHAFRGAAGFPETARHLFALQYQGQFWSQANGKDWTPSAFLSSSEGGLGLDLARDRASLEAPDFHGLAASDPVGLLLEWMALDGGTTADWPTERRLAFSALCKQQFGFDPDKDGALTAAEKLVAGGGVWDQVWRRYRQAPLAYAGVRKVLELVHPKDLIDQTNERIPLNNRQQESLLRTELGGLEGLPRK